MKNILKGIFFKLSYNLKMRKVANKIFVYFPKLKTKLVGIRDSSYTPKYKEKIIFTSDFLLAIKKEIEDQKDMDKS